MEYSRRDGRRHEFERSRGEDLGRFRDSHWPSGAEGPKATLPRISSVATDFIRGYYRVLPDGRSSFPVPRRILLSAHECQLQMEEPVGAED